MKTLDDVLKSAVVGFEFEFYSELSPIETARLLSKITDKRVVVPHTVPALGRDGRMMYHSPVKPTRDVFKLEKDYSGGKNMLELVTGPMPYIEAIAVLNKILKFIRDYGYTNKFTGIHINISFDKEKADTATDIQNLNVLKYILNFDEEKIYEIFPERRENIYAKSIKKLVPRDFYFCNNFPANVAFAVEGNLKLPTSEKWYGINFLKRDKGYLEYRYIGGTNYEKKAYEIIEAINYFIVTLYDTLNTPEKFSDKEILVLKELFDKYNKFARALDNADAFEKEFPEIKLFVDLKSDKQILKTFWHFFKKELFDLVAFSGFRKGRANFDTQFNSFQIAYADLDNVNAEKLEFVDCNITNSILTRCSFYNCNVENCRIMGMWRVSNNVFKNCFIKSKKATKNNNKIIDTMVNFRYIKNNEAAK